MMTPPAPAGLGATSVGIWRQLTALPRFEAHELIAFERALRWFHKADAW